MYFFVDEGVEVVVEFSLDGALLNFLYEFEVVLAECLNNGVEFVLDGFFLFDIKNSGPSFLDRFEHCKFLIEK